MRSIGRSTENSSPDRWPRRSLALVTGILLLAGLVAACGQPAPAQPPAAALTAVGPTAAPTGAPAAAAITPIVTVSDQDILGGKVHIAQVIGAGPGWLVIHAEQDGKPGPVLGYSAVKEGDNGEVSVEIDTAQVTGTLYAMLHTDSGQLGTYEFPGPDAPVVIAGQMINAPFQVSTGLAAVTPAPTAITAPPATALPAATTTSAATAAPAATTTSTPTMGTAPTVAVGEGEVELEDFQFQPRVLTVRAGTTVKFENKDDTPHTVTSDTGAFDSGMLSKGQEYSFTFTQPGEYPYYCAPHGSPGGIGMSGTIIVVP